MDVRDGIAKSTQQRVAPPFRREPLSEPNAGLTSLGEETIALHLAVGAIEFCDMTGWAARLDAM